MLILVNDSLLRVCVYTGLCFIIIWIHSPYYFVFLFIFHITIIGFLIHTRFISQPTVSFSSLCIRVYMLIFGQWLRPPSAFTLTLFYSPFYIDFLFIFHMAIDWISYTYLVHLIVCKFKFVNRCLYAHPCQWLPPASAYIGLCFIIIWISPFYFDFLFISDMNINWISYAHSVHLT